MMLSAGFLPIRRYNINGITIYSCFRKSQIIQPQMSLPAEPAPYQHSIEKPSKLAISEMQ